MKIKANGITFNVQIDGPEGAPWIVFSNSLATNLTMWDEQAAHFKSRYRVLRYDQRGHGGTDAPEGPYTFDLLVADVIGLFDALSIERAHFAGVSMGGMTALGLAENHPDRLLSVAPCDCSSASTPASAQQWGERIAQARQGGMPAMVDSTLTRWFPTALTPEAPPFIPKVREMILTTPVAGFIGCCGALADFNYQPGLGAIRVPVLVAVGTKDQMLAGSRQIHADIPGSTLVELEGAGHLSNVDRPAEYNRALERFIETS
ncbi:MAG: alpha/beta fold hydrolase [Candidatus Lustribacter sp.]|jgi:3-oxoadipate enol-lactonase